MRTARLIVSARLVSTIGCGCASRTSGRGSCSGSHSHDEERGQGRPAGAGRLQRHRQERIPFELLPFGMWNAESEVWGRHWQSRPNASSRCALTQINSLAAHTCARLLRSWAREPCGDAGRARRACLTQAHTARPAGLIRRGPCAELCRRATVRSSWAARTRQNSAVPVVDRRLLRPQQCSLATCPSQAPAPPTGRR